MYTTSKNFRGGPRFLGPFGGYRDESFFLIPTKQPQDPGGIFLLRMEKSRNRPHQLANILSPFLDSFSVILKSGTP